MTRAYSEDLRTRVVGAVDAGAQPTAHHRTDIAGESLSRPLPSQGRRSLGTCGCLRRRTRDNANGERNGRRPVRGCPGQTGVAARSFLRTPDGESHETVRSALWQRAATGRTRVLSVRPRGHTPGSMRAPELPLPMSFGSAALATKRAPAVNAEAKAKR